MAAPDPLLAIGSVFDLRRARRSGTCTAFRHAQLVLTAGHCVENLEAAEVEVEFIAVPGRRTVAEISRHPTADLALLRLAAAGGLDGVVPLTAVARVAESGPEFVGFGSADGAATVAEARERLFEGRIRRAFTDRADGHRHAELSVPVFDGYSGGPLVAATAPQALLGVITANRRGRFARRGNHGHGIALLAGELCEWIDEHAPELPRSQQPRAQ
jgi:hypothetical protein